MEDRDVIEAFVSSGARQAFGPNLHIEGDALFLHGWWHGAFRVAPDTFIVRNEEPPDDSRALEDVAESLAGRGLQQVGVDLPLIQPITYTALSLGSVSWALWASGLARGEEALAARVAVESYLDDSQVEPSPPNPGFTAELGGARRVAGLPPMLILAVGIAADTAHQLEAALPDCQVEARRLEEIAPDVCGTLIPALVLVDATARIGREFIMELRADACGRFLPVVALTGEGDVPLGADAALDPAQPPGSWVEPLRRLLP